MAMKNITYKVPHNNKEVCVNPALDLIPEMILANKRKIQGYTCEINGIPLPVLRDQTRFELVHSGVRYTEGIQSLIQKDQPGSCRYVRDGCHEDLPRRSAQETVSVKGLDLDYEAIKNIPIVQTGHEPVFYYPGVWIKNHLAYYLATKIGGIGVNMIVDNDAGKMGFVYMPVLSEKPVNMRKIVLVEDRDDVPYEEVVFGTMESILRFREEMVTLFQKNFTDETIKTTMESMLSTFENFMDCVVGCYRMGCTDMVGLLSAARCSLETGFCMDNLEIPVSWMSSTDGFYQFFLHLVYEAERFTHIYNEKLAEYRALHKIRSKANPLPDLKADGNAVELPFWVWKACGRREKCYLMKEGESFGLADGGEVFLTFKKSEGFQATMAKLRGLEHAHVKLRPRAITTTMFSRLFFSDIFIHGIGGAKYDTITDEIVREFFGIDPPSFATISTTLFLPLDTFNVDAGMVQLLHRELKDMGYNPERYASEGRLHDEVFVSRVKEKQRLLEVMAICSGEEKRRCFHQIGELNKLNLADLGDEMQRKKREIAEANLKLSYNEMVRFREYPVAIYPMKALKEYFLHVF